MTNYTPLRYPGGKGKFAPYVAEVMQMNELVGGHYVEPFAGGAGVALWLLFSEYAAHIHINDLDKNIYCFWKSVLEETDELCKKIKKTPVTVNEWLRQREIKNNADEFTSLERGFATFYLNRTNYSGVINGGVIGGVEQKGNWKIDARYNKEDLIERIRRIALYADRISLYNMDACKFITKSSKKVPANSLMYLDPPYYVKGGWLYQNSFRHEDHEVLASYISNIRNYHWMLSYDNEPTIKELYSSYEQEEFSLNYSAGSHARGSEVMIFQDGLKRPERIMTTKAQRKSA